jgi:hypothetical protein
MSVYHSLIRWLEELKNTWEIIEYNVNSHINKIHETVIVLLWKDTLRYALDLKKQWTIKTILAWPAISVPINNSDLFFHPNIDTILVPSSRIKDYFYSLLPYKSERVKIRPAWVKDTGISIKSKTQILIYKKTCPEELYKKIVTYLDIQWIKHTTLQYWKFQFSEYQEILDETVAMIYLQESESQWIALQEARIKDIPTLVRDRGYREYDWQKKREAQKISCPLLDESCWKTFCEKTFIQEYISFMKNRTSFTPRNYCLKNLHDTATTKILLSFI